MRKYRALRLRQGKQGDNISEGRPLHKVSLFFNGRVDSSPAFLLQIRNSEKMQEILSKIIIRVMFILVNNLFCVGVYGTIEKNTKEVKL